MEKLNRRSTDNMTFSIESMIANESDADKRMQLIVLNNIQNTVVQNTVALAALDAKLELHIKKLDLHIKADDALLNKFKGVWFLLPSALLILQLIGGYMMNQFSSNLDRINKTLVDNQINLVKEAAEIEAMEHRLGDHMSEPKSPGLGLHQ